MPTIPITFLATASVARTMQIEVPEGLDARAARALAEERAADVMNKDEDIENANKTWEIARVESSSILISKSVVLRTDMPALPADFAAAVQTSGLAPITP